MLDQAGKLAAHQVAATLTSAVIGNLPDTLLIAEPKDNPGLLTVNLMTWEVHRIFYHAIIGTLESTDWPAPNFQIDLSAILGPLSGVLGSPAISALMPMLQGLLGGGGSPPPPPVALPTAPK